MHAVGCKRAPSFDEVNVNTVYWSPSLPELGLVGDPSADLRVYVLRCGGRFYAGITERAQVPRRMQIESQQGPSAPNFVKKYRLTTVLGVWPVSSYAAEPYVFYAILGSLDENDALAGRIGGWTQALQSCEPLGSFQVATGSAHGESIVHEM